MRTQQRGHHPVHRRIVQLHRARDAALRDVVDQDCAAVQPDVLAAQRRQPEGALVVVAACERTAPHRAGTPRCPASVPPQRARAAVRAPVRPAGAPPRAAPWAGVAPARAPADVSPRPEPAATPGGSGTGVTQRYRCQRPGRARLLHPGAPGSTRVRSSTRSVEEPRAADTTVLLPEERAVLTPRRRSTPSHGTARAWG